MNKYLSLFLFAVVLLSSGFIYQKYYRPKEVGGARHTGNVVEIKMRVLENKWKWEPDKIKVLAGDKVVLHIYNEDTYDHGFAIDVFGVNKRLFPRTTTLIEFVPTIKGSFKFYCSVPCGKGHYDQIGTLVVIEEGNNNQSLNFKLR